MQWGQGPRGPAPYRVELPELWLLREASEAKHFLCPVDSDRRMSVTELSENWGFLNLAGRALT